MCAFLRVVVEVVSAGWARIAHGSWVPAASSSTDAELLTVREGLQATLSILQLVRSGSGC